MVYADVKHHDKRSSEKKTGLELTGRELRSCVNVEVAVLGSQSIIVLNMTSADVGIILVVTV